MFRKKPAAPTLPPEWLIVGLGNPGPEYRGTRHNVGFEVIDELADRWKGKLATRQHKATFGVMSIRGVPMVLAKPMTYMNLSGQAVAPLLRAFSLSPDRLIVIADELDLPLGRVQMKPGGGAAGHNGHKSVQQALGTQQYARIRIGIGKGDEATIDHVLGRFHGDDLATAMRSLERAADAIERVAESGLEQAIGWLNSQA